MKSLAEELGINPATDFLYITKCYKNGFTLVHPNYDNFPRLKVTGMQSHKTAFSNFLVAEMLKERNLF